MNSNNKWRSTLKYNKVLGFAACLSVAILLISGNALAGNTNSPCKSGSPAPACPTYAVQVGGPGIVYTITTAGFFTRQIQATRNQLNDTAPNSAFLLRVDLQSGFTFYAGGLPQPGDIYDYTSKGGVGGDDTGINLDGVEIYDGGQSGDTYVRYYIPTDAGDGIAFTSATVTIRPNSWKIKDNAGYLAGLSGDEKYMEVKATLFEVQGTQQFDSDMDEASDTARLIRAANGVEAKVSHEGRKVIDLENTRKYFEALFPVDRTNDMTPRLDLREKPFVLAANGQPYKFNSDINFTLTFASNLAGIENIQWAGGSCEITTTTGIMSVPGTNGCFGYGVPITIDVDGVTSLDARVLNVTVAYTIKHNSSLNDTALADARLTEWIYNGSLLISTFSNANTTAWRSRYYIWNYDNDPSSILVRVLTLPINGNKGSKALGLGQVVYRYTVAGNSGITIRLEDVLTDIGAPGPQLGDEDDNSGNVYVEFSFGSMRTAGWTQIFDPSVSTFMGMIQMYNTIDFPWK